MITTGERQYGTLDEIRKDHLARYEFAYSSISRGDMVIDAACGCGYGSYILSRKAVRVYGIDSSIEAIDYALKYYNNDRIFYLQREIPCELPVANVGVCFETIEHVTNPLGLLKEFKEKTNRLFASVPNQDRLPFKKEQFPFHHRHYTKYEFCELLLEAGWKPQKWYGQEDAWSDVKENVNGRTLVVECV